jgi:hypothetical protein
LARLGFEHLPNTTDWYGRWRLTQNPSSDWMIDRQVQRSGESFTGIPSIHGQDQAVTESMGGITDHGFENLAPSDLMIARTRRRLLRAARAFAKDGWFRLASTSRDLHRRAQRRFPRRRKDRLA